MAIRDIYLKIEEIPDYSPVDPDPTSPTPYRRDCMRNPGHENGTIPQSEAAARTLNALVYREYLDPSYLVPKPDKIVATDVNEPAFHRRVPGAVLYAHPGDRLRIHVLNEDSMPHSLHMHGLRFGIDSDGSWPLGTQSSDGRRSDEICPGDSWTYTFDVTEDMVGPWPFHDHYQHIADNVNRGLFGGLIVLPKAYKPPPPFKLPGKLQDLIDEPPRGFPRFPKPVLGGAHGAMRGHVLFPDPGPGGFEPRPPIDFEVAGLRELLEHLMHRPIPLDPRPARVLHVPLFFHYMSGQRGTPIFRSPTMVAGQQFTQTFAVEGVYTYFCEVHGQGMSGTVRVQMGGPAQASVTIVDNQFQPDDVPVGPGGSVVWTHAGANQHTVTENGGTTIPTFCFNGRAFIGNSPTILTHTGQRIRWYVFNLDLGMNWHNFHLHSTRWRFADQWVDNQSIGPAESFVVETVAPPALLLPPDIEATQSATDRPEDAKQVRVRGDFLFHCHVEMHMMQGLTGVLRSRQTLWLTQEQEDRVRAESGLPIDDGTNYCVPVDMQRCQNAGTGVWEEVPGAPEVTMMHSILLPQTTKVLYWGYTRADQSRLWDYGPAPGYSSPPNQPADVVPAGTPDPVDWSDLWSGEHAFLDTSEGTLLAHGGFTDGELQTFLFHPSTLTWELDSPTQGPRFYATTITLGDGRILTLFGNDRTIEVWQQGAGWGAPIPFPLTYNYQYYPWTFLLPSGKLFIAGPTGVSRRFDWNAPVDDPAETWPTIAGNRSTGGEKGSAVLLPLRPPTYTPRVVIVGGNTAAAESTAEIIDLSAATPSWSSLPNLNQARPEQFTATLLPDGRVWVAGGVPGAPGAVEIFDPSNPAAGWELGPNMSYPRGYHSSAVLLPDGSVLIGGDPPGMGGPTPHERFFPGYCFKPRPTITNAPATVNYASAISIETPDAADIAEVALIRPGATTHGFNMSQRFVGCEITGRTAGSVDVAAPPDGNTAPPGYYLLFILSAGRVPSEGRWIRLTV